MRIKPITTMNWKMPWKKPYTFNYVLFGRSIRKELFLRISPMCNTTIAKP